MNILETRDLAVGYDRKKVVGNINLEVKKASLSVCSGPTARANRRS